MALPKKLKNFNLFGNGDNWQGQIASLTLPELARQMEEYRGGGMNAPMDIDMGMQKLEFQWTPAGLIPELFDNFGTPQADGEMLRFAGSYQRALVAAGKAEHFTVCLGSAEIVEQFRNQAGGGPLEFQLLHAHVDVHGGVHAAAPVLFHLPRQFGQGEAGDLALPVIAVAEQVEVLQLLGECHRSVLLMRSRGWRSRPGNGQ